MNGAYIADFVSSMREAGVSQVREGNESRWSYQSEFQEAEMVFDASIGVGIIRDEEYPNLAMGIQDYGIVGDQFNVIGYSYGALVAAQVAIKYARQYSGITDNLVLIGAPISQSFLEEIYAEPKIGNVRIVNLAEFGDPIYAGMPYVDLLASIPILAVQYKSETGHFYYSAEGVNGRERRKQLADTLYSEGIR